MRVRSGVLGSALTAALMISSGGGCSLETDLGRGVSAVVVSASGTVTDSSSAPIPGVRLDFVQMAMVVGTTTTAPDGSWSIMIEEGVYDIVVDPPAASIFVPQTLFGQTVDASTNLTIVLVSGGVLSYDLHVQDRVAAPLVAMQVCVSPTGPGSSTCGTTDASGDVSLAVAPGDYTVSVSQHMMPGGPGNPQLPQMLDLHLPARSLTGDFAETVTVPDRAVTGLVLDAGGTPVPNAGVFLTIEDSDPMTGASSRSEDWGTTAADGRFALRGLPGSARLQVTPEAASGLPSSVELFVVTVDADITVNLPAPARYDAHVQDRDAVALVSMQVCVSPIGPGTSACGTTDASGDVSLSVTPGDYTVSVSQHMMPGGPGNPQLSQMVDLHLPVQTLSGIVTETVTVPNRAITGLVLDAGGTPVPNASLFLTIEDSDPMTGASSRSEDWGTTAVDGRFALRGIPGSARLQVTPEVSSGLPNTTELFVVTVDADITVNLVPPATYDVHVEDRDAVALVAMQVCASPSGPGSSACGTTDASGDVSLSVTPGDYTLSVSQHMMPGGPGNPQLPQMLDVHLPLRTISGVVAETVTVPNRAVDGIVADADGNGVASASLFLTIEDHDPMTGASSRSEDWSTTAADGRFALRGMPGLARLQVNPDPASGLASFELRDVVITGDASLAALVQFLTDASSTTVMPGGTATTDDEADGATPADPVETQLTSPLAGDVTIQESPITETPPLGYGFLTQQVNITAPAATAADPLVIQFIIDASRIPPGEDETTIEIFRNAVLVPACTGAPGVAAPDPCISSRVVVGDDAVITALTSAASAWNIGVHHVGDGDGDGIPDDVDACPADPEDLDGFQDEDGCPDLDNDGDGVPDTIDACPDQAEDLDGFEDDDGCPEDGPGTPGTCPDFDGDGAVTVRDQVQLTRAMGSSVGDRRYRADVDLDHDGDVDVDDLRIFRPHRGTTCAAP